MATVIQPDGTRTQWDAPAANGRFTLSELQEKVGGYIQYVKTDTHTIVLVVDEDGKMKGYPPNMEATKMMSKLHRLGDHIVGTAVCLFKKELPK